MKQQANLVRADPVIEHDGHRWTVLKQQIITPGTVVACPVCCGARCGLGRRLIRRRRFLVRIRRVRAPGCAGIINGPIPYT